LIEKFETENYEEEEKENFNPEAVQPNNIFEPLELDQPVDDMESQLNPDAKEFIPVSPVSRSQEFSSPPPPENGFDRPLANPILSNFDDAVVSQSPRKGEALIMEDVPIPATENEFDLEADARPHEVNLMEENFQRIDSPSAKEAMQIDEKLEQSYTADDSQHFEEETQQQNEDYKTLEKSFEAYSNGFQSKIDDAMNRSFYEGRDGDILAHNDVLNTVQPIPSFEDEQPEADHHHVEPESDKVEADLLGGFEEVQKVEITEKVEKIEEVPQKVEEILQEVQQEILPQEVPQVMIESNDNFEAEQFVEEIKGASESKYVDTELSPTTEFNPIEFSSPPIVEETIVTHTSFKENLSEMNLDTMIVETSKTDILEPQAEVIEAPEAEFKPVEIADIPETVEPAQEAKEEAKIEPKTTEVVSEEVKKAVKAIDVKKAPVAAAKKPTTTTKAPVKPAEIKKTEIKPRTAPPKPASAPIKPPVSKTTVKAPTSATARPTTTKPAVSSAPLVKKTTSTVAAARTITKPAPKPATSATTVPAAKRPVTSATTAR
jgi:hypothetical protein